MMQAELFSDKYKVYRLTDRNIDEVYQLLSKNILYYEYCPPFVTRQKIQEDMRILPPGKVSKDKYYVGFYQGEKLIAVMDLIDGYPEKGIAYIGLFMTDISVQNKGIGTEIIDGLCRYLSGLSYKSIRLAWVKGNPQSERFWLKNGFMPLMETTSNAAAEVILAEKIIDNMTVDDLEIRGMMPKEYPLLKDFLYDAIYLPEGVVPPPKEIIERPELAVYIENFGLPDDLCLAAESKGHVLGAVWTRILGGEVKGYGNVDEYTPEFSISVKKEFRWQGIGERLMREMIELLRNKGYERASLSVNKDNYAYYLYQKLGFQVIKEQEEDYLMVLEL